MIGEGGEDKREMLDDLAQSIEAVEMMETRRTAGNVGICTICGQEPCECEISESDYEYGEPDCHGTGVAPAVPATQRSEDSD